MSTKLRLDTYLVEKGFFENKSQAGAAILAGNVKINDARITKAGFQVKDDEELNIEVKYMPYVSRGGFKLETAFKNFNISVKDKICLDAGASTGGFTDCMLQNGAQKVYAVDVGYGQLAWKLRSDDRVVTLEKTNIRNASIEDIYKQEEIASLAVMDLSFISLTKVLENIKTLLQGEQEMIALIKPQFEAGKEQIGKNGVVKDKAVHIETIQKVIDFATSIELHPQELTYSSIKGPKGNIEYLVYLANKEVSFDNDIIKKMVEEAYDELN